MSNPAFNDYTGHVDVSGDQLKKGLTYARKNQYHGLAITAPNNKEATIDFSVLDGDSSIEDLYISEDVPLKGADLSFLYTMSRLSKLTVQFLRGKIDFSRLGRLDTLYLLGADSVIDSIDIPTLRSLLIVLTKNVNCQFLASLDNLEDLRVSGGKIESMVGIERLSKLKSVQIDHCPKLVDVSSLGSVGALTDLYIEKCKGLSDFGFLRENRSIERLFLSDLDSVDFVPSMQKLEYLKFWNLKDADMTCLPQSGTLRQVDFYPQKRGYSHTIDEINALLASKNTAEQ